MLITAYATDREQRKIYLKYNQKLFQRKKWQHQIYHHLVMTHIMELITRVINHKDCGKQFYRAKSCDRNNTFSIFVQNFNFCPKFQFLSKISIFVHNFNFCLNFPFLSKISIFIQNFNFYPKFQFLSKISIFVQNFDFFLNFDSYKISISLFCKNRVLLRMRKKYFWEVCPYRRIPLFPIYAIAYSYILSAIAFSIIICYDPHIRLWNWNSTSWNGAKYIISGKVQQYR